MKITHGSILAVFLQSTPDDRAEGAYWYARAQAVASDIAYSYCDNDLKKAAGVIAALSPNNRWNRNVKDAENLAKVFAVGGDVDSLKVSTFGKNKEKAIAILKGADPLDVLGGLKVRAFYQCILGEDSVCVDGHAYSIWLGERVPTTKTPKISEKLYNQIAADYRLAAKQINQILGIVCTASQVQAITWIVWRKLFHGEAE